MTPAPTYEKGTLLKILGRIMEPFWFLTTIVIIISQIESSLQQGASETDRRVLEPI